MTEAERLIELARLGVREEFNALVRPAKSKAKARKERNDGKNLTEFWKQVGREEAFEYALEAIKKTT